MIVVTLSVIAPFNVEAAAAAAEQNVQIDGRLVHCALSHSRYRSVKDLGP